MDIQLIIIILEYIIAFTLWKFAPLQFYLPTIKFVIGAIIITHLVSFYTGAAHNFKADRHIFQKVLAAIVLLTATVFAGVFIWGVFTGTWQN